MMADSVPNLAGVAMLLLGLALPLRRGVAAAARLVAAQGGLLAFAAAGAAAAESSGAGPHLWLLALGALAGRALLVPTLFRLLAARTGADRAEARVGGGAALLVAGGGLAVLAVAALVPAGVGLAPGMRVGLALALAVLLLGLLTALLRRGVGFALLGLLAAENGALLALVHAGGALPGAAALAVLSPGLVASIALASRGGLRGLLRAPSWAAWR
jgi:hydrogenase-4 membrane subunit HyfE